MNSIILGHDNRFLDATPTATDTDAGSQYDVLNVRDLRPYTRHRFAGPGTKYITVDLNRLPEPGFESDGASWTLGDATVETANPASGSKHARLAASGADATGPTSGAIIKPGGEAYLSSEAYTLSYKLAVSGYTAGNARLQVLFLDKEGNTISTSTLTTLTADQGYVAYSKTVGSGGDAEIPAGTYGIKVRALADGTPTLTLDLDDVLFHNVALAEALVIMGHNLWSANAAVSVESCDDDTGALTNWTERLAGFTPSDDKALHRTFTGVSARAWRVKFVTANIAAELGMLILGGAIEFPKPPRSGFDPVDEGRVVHSNVSEVGHPLGNIVKYRPVSVRPEWPRLSRAWVMETLKPAYDAHLHKKYFIWVANIPGDTYQNRPLLVTLSERYRFQAALKVLERVDKFVLDMEGVVEQ